MIYLEVAYHGVTNRDDLLQKIVYPCLKEDKAMGALKTLGMFSPADGDTSELSCILVFKDLAAYEDWSKKGEQSAVYKELGPIEREGHFYAKMESRLLTSTEYDAIDWES